MSKINLKKIAQDYGFHMEVTSYPLLKKSSQLVKMWIDTQIDPILVATDEAETYIRVAWGVTKKPVNSHHNFYGEVCIYNEKSNEKFLREQLNKVIKTYQKRMSCSRV